MFTGLIQRIGTVKRVSRGAGLVVEIVADSPWEKPLEEGESIAVNGVCLTAAKCAGSRFTADVLRETEDRTGIGSLLPGTKVNLERAVRAGEPLGGHIVQGHVDCRGRIAARTARGRDFHLEVVCGRVVAAGTVLKGSIAIDGVSLTVSSLGEDWVGVDIIPTTAADTTLGSKRPGDYVNVESDIIGKYMAKKSVGGITEEKLAAAGFM